MGILVSVLAVIAAIVLVLIVLVQNSKGGGLSANFSSSNQIMGVRKTTDFLEKATWGLAGFIIILSILSTRLSNDSANAAAQTEVSAPTAAPVSNTTSPDVSLPGAQSAPVQQGGEAKKEAQPQQQSSKPSFPVPAKK